MKPSPFLVAEDLAIRRGTRMVLDGVSAQIPPDTYTTTVYFTVYEYY